jgi:hypothetical protein
MPRSGAHSKRHLRSVDELIVDGAITRPTWQALAGELDKQQLLDLIFTVGSYDTLDGMMSSLELGIDDEISELMQKYDELF